MKKAITILDNEKFLRQTSQKVDFNDKSYLDDIEALKEYCKENGYVWAMASIQIGISKRLIYIKNSTENMDANLDSNYDESKILINPVIIKRIGHTRFLESCASCPDTSNSSLDPKGKYLACLVDRPYLIEVEYYDIEGKKNRETFKDFEATVLSHEYDHLNGILHIDLGKEIIPLSFEERKEYREKYPYKIISEDCDFDSIK